MDAGKRAVLLDGLGTLLALAPPGPVLARLLAVEHGLAVTEEQAARAFAAEIVYYREHHHEGRDDASLAELRLQCAAVLREELPAYVAQALPPQRLAAAMLAALRFSVYPDAAPALAGLRSRGLRLVVVSNWDVSLPEVLARAGLAELLDGVVTSAGVGAPKPDPAIFAVALALAGVAAHEAIHVGDSPTHDVAGARAAGIEPVLLRRAGTEAAHIGEPEGRPVAAQVATIRSLNDLLTASQAQRA